MNSRFCKASLLLAVFCSVLNADSKQDWTARYRAWLCKVAGYGCNIKDVADTRKGDHAHPLGGDLMTYDVATPQGRFIWQNCGCWSPMPIDADSLAVVTEDGIWAIPLSHPAGRKLIYKSPDVLDLLQVRGSPPSILLLKSSKENGCAFQPFLLNTETFKSTSAPEEIDLDCGKEWDDTDLVKPAQIANGNTLTASIFNGKYKIYLGDRDGIKPLLPAAGAKGECFDPVWITKSLMAFVSGQ
jgi:hypothetical protein